MKKIAMAVILLSVLAFGFFLPTLAGNMQDWLQIGRQERYALAPLPNPPIADSASAAESDPPQMDEPEASDMLVRLKQYQGTGGYVLLTVDPDQETVLNALKDLQDQLFKAGILTDETFDTVSITTQIGNAYLSPEYSMLLWSYTGQTENEDELHVLFDPETGKAVSITLQISESPTQSTDPQGYLDQWEAFFEAYYDLSRATFDDTTMPRRAVTFVDKNDLSVSFPFQAVVLAEYNVGDLKVQYRFNF